MIAGIVLQWHGQLNAATWWIVTGVTLLIIILFFLLPFFKQYRYAYLNGIFISLIGFSLGALLAADRNIRNDKQWLGNFYQPNNGIIVTLDEPPVEKTKSIKATASVSYLIQNSEAKAVTGKIIPYFKKDSLLKLDYGSQVLLKKPLP